MSSIPNTENQIGQTGSDSQAEEHAPSQEVTEGLPQLVKNQSDFTVYINNNGEQQYVVFSYQISNYHIKHFMDSHEAVLPKFNSLRPFQAMKQFVELQGYQPVRVVRKATVDTKDLKSMFTEPKYYSFFQKYSDINSYGEEAEELYSLAKFLDFTLLEEAVGVAIAVNFFVGSTDQEINKFIAETKLQKMKPAEIAQIIEAHQSVFDEIHEQMHNLGKQKKGKEQNPALKH